jgi:hypothetical protein
MHLEAWTSTDADVKLEALIEGLEMNGLKLVDGEAL